MGRKSSGPFSTELKGRGTTAIKLMKFLFRTLSLAVAIASAAPLVSAGQPNRPAVQPASTYAKAPAAAPATTAILPSQDIQAQVSAAAPGTTFLLKAGIHRLRSIVPKDGQTFVGETGAILSGARVLTTFSRAGEAWVALNQTQQGPAIGNTDEVCRADAPRCGYPEDLFINGEALQHVESLAAGGPGKWYFDYPADKIYFWDDPTAKTVETSVTAAAFGGPATGVTIRHLVIEKYASPTQQATVSLGVRWLLEDCELRSNHSAAVANGANSVSRRNFVHHNGGLGLQGDGENVVIEDNEIAYNNYAGYNPYWGAGGAKWVYTTNLVVRGNFAHHNGGPGLWTDINNVFTLYENNIVEDNERGGIFHEISYDATIRRNTARRNGTGRAFPSWTTGAGIEIVGSPNVEVYENVLEDNWQGITALDDHRGTGTRGPWTVVNLHVHDNTITSRVSEKGAGRTGLVDTSGTAAFSAKANNRFRQNTYTLGANAQYFMWMGADYNESGWRSFGLDASSTFQR
jgi:parallel beta-helix repeat protein